MKNNLLISILFTFCLFTSDFLLFAQAPQAIPYQAIARNTSGTAIASTAVKVRFSIRDSIATGPVRYQETHTPTTSALGLFSVNVGAGTVVSGSFTGINWGKNAKFLQVELDPAGGNSYTNLGTTQMMSVPYALNAGNGLPSSGIAKDDILKFDGTNWKPGKTIPTFTTKQRDELPTASKSAGFTFFNSSTKCLEYYDGTSWLSLCGSTAMVGDSSIPYDLTEIGQKVSRLTLPSNFCGGEWIGSNNKFALFYTQSWGLNCTPSYAGYAVYKFNPATSMISQVPTPIGFFQIQNTLLQSTRAFSITYQDKIVIISNYYLSQSNQNINKIYKYDDGSNSWSVLDIWSNSNINESFQWRYEKGFLVDSLFYFKSTNLGTASINLNSGEIIYNTSIYNPATPSNELYSKYFDVTNDEKIIIEKFGLIRKFKPKQFGKQDVIYTNYNSGWDDMNFIKSNGNKYYFSLRENYSKGRIFVYDFIKGTSRFLDNTFFDYNQELGNNIRIGNRFFRLRDIPGIAPNCSTFEIIEVMF